MIFVDTSAWFAVAVREDADHEDAARWIEENGFPLITTDWIALETVNLIRYRLRGRRGHRRAVEIGDSLWEGRSARLVRLEPEDLRRAREIFRAYADKVWSLTDCSSFAAMERLGIDTAFAFDDDFDRFPGIHRVPRDS